MTPLPKVQTPTALPGTGKPSGMTTRGSGTHRAELRGGVTPRGQLIKSYPSTAIEMGERFGKD
jgi:hypothetical protein